MPSHALAAQSDTASPPPELAAGFRDRVSSLLQALEIRWQELDGYAVNANRVLASEELRWLATGDGRALLLAVRRAAFEAYVTSRDRARTRSEEAEQAAVALVKASAVYTFVDSLMNNPVTPANPRRDADASRRPLLRRAG